MAVQFSQFLRIIRYPDSHNSSKKIGGGKLFSGPLEIAGNTAKKESEKTVVEGSKEEEKRGWREKESGWRNGRKVGVVLGGPEEVISWAQPSSLNPHLNQSHFPSLSSVCLIDFLFLPLS